LDACIVDPSSRTPGISMTGLTMTSITDAIQEGQKLYVSVAGPESNNL